MSSQGETTVSSAPPERGHRLGKYVILAEVARGGMSEVYLARRDGSRELCILKQLKAGLLGNEIIEKRFEREAALCALLAHPGIARVFDSGVEDGTFCIAMELIPGQTISDIMREVLVRRSTIPPELAIAIMVRVLDALDYAHEVKGAEGQPLDLVHRDLSPRNVMLSYFGDVKIIDFGLARGNLGDFRTKPGQLLGTLRYISPEQARGEPVDRRTDVYSASVILFEMLAGRALYKTDQPLKTLRAVVYDPVPSLESFAPDLPEAARRAVLRGLAKEPGERPATAGALAAELRSIFGSAVDLEPSTLGHYLHALFPGHARMMLELVRQHDPGLVRPSDMSRPEPDGSGTAITDVTAPGASASVSPVEADEPTPIAPSPLETVLSSTPTVPGASEVSSAPDTPLVLPAVDAVPQAVAPTVLVSARLKRRKDVDRLERSLRRWRNGALVAGLVALTAVTALITSSSAPPVQPAPLAPPPVQPSAAVRPAVEPRPRPELIEPPPEPEALEPEPPPAKRPRTGAAKRPPESARDPQPRAKSELESLLAALRANPKDVGSFERLYEAIERRARTLPRDRRSAVTSVLNAASLTGDVEGLARAVETLERERAASE